MSNAEDYDDWDDFSNTAGICPKCGNHDTRGENCGECEDGMINRYDEDPLWYADEWVMCPSCHGHEYHAWCPKCGLDLLGKEAERLKTANAAQGIVVAAESGSASSQTEPTQSPVPVIRDAPKEPTPKS